jgi:hypothetical protein
MLVPTPAWLRRGSGPPRVVAEMVLRRVELDLPETQGSPQLDVTDPGVLEVLSLAAGKIVRNEDGVRPASLRRTAIDVLEREQSTDALGELKLSRQALEDALAQDRLFDAHSFAGRAPLS